jgi:hypothetical protein
LADSDGNFYSFCAATGTTNYVFNIYSVVSSNEYPLRLHSPLIALDGTVYVDAYSRWPTGYIFAFAGPSPVACAPWPEDRKNARRSGAFSPPAFESLPIYATNGFSFVISGMTNMTTCVCASTNLVDWTNIGQITLTNGQMGFLDTNAAKYDKRFYFPRGQ